MKLYTEEQLLNTIKSVRHYDDVHDWKVANEMIEKHLKALEPIELPSDEEIEDNAKDYANLIGNKNGTSIFDYVRGAKWMRDKIQGGNK